VSVLRQGTLLALAAAVSWLLFLYEADPGVSATPQPHERRPLAVAVLPAEPASAPVLEVPEPLARAPLEALQQLIDDGEASEQAVAPPERGTPAGEDDGPALEDELAEAEEVPSSEPEEPEPARTEDLMRSAALVEAARREIAGESRQGFSTVLLAAPEDQLDIARSFGEEVVLVPRSVLDDEAQSSAYFRLDLSAGAQVTRIAGQPPLTRYRQYRDLFDYEYARLPEPLRRLRRSVLSRSEVYLFAALIPLREWAVVIGRRRAALARTGRDLAEVRKFVLRYVRTDAGLFDFRVEEIAFADGTRTSPLLTD